MYLPVVATVVVATVVEAAVIVAAVVVEAVVPAVVESLVAVVAVSTAPGPSVAAVSSGEAPMTRYQVVSV